MKTATFALPLLALALSLGAAQAQDSMKKMAPKPDTMTADCMKMSKAEKDATKMAAMEKSCAEKASMKAHTMKGDTMAPKRH